MLFSLSSCLFVNPDGSQDSKNSYDTENELKDTEYISDSDLGESGTDTDTDTNNDADSNVSSDSDTEIDSSDDVIDDTNDNSCKTNGHLDYDKNDYCDTCNEYLIVVIDFYAINDLHGKFCDSNAQPGVDELGTYFENRKQEDDHIVLLSSGDMWQGSAESVLSYGKIMVDWMNELGFASMTLGNHEFDWGEQIIKDNALLAEFPFLAINIYNKSTGMLAEYCSPSIVVDRGDIQIGIIGAIGDCYSSISSDMVTDVYFKTGDELTSLVKDESNRLRGLGADIIVYSIHDGYGNCYDDTLSNGYVDIVFEGHTHKSYINTDSNGIVHIQGGAENYGLSHIEIEINSVTGSKNISAKNIVTNQSYASLDDHQPTELIEDKYADIIDYAYTTLGTVSKKQYSNDVTDYVAELYLKAGKEKWGNQYDIALGGGFLQTRSPYDLSAGSVSYADILSLLPFNNRIVLCYVSGLKLKSQFINSSNSSYHIALNDNFDTSNIMSNGTYYVVVDMYTALYKYNGLTIVDYYDQTTYARDLYAQAIKDGMLDTGSSDTTTKPDTEYTITSIKYALEEGEKLKAGGETTEYLYYKGTISDLSNLTYGNCYLTDEEGNTIYVFGLKDSYGNRYDAMSQKPVNGDTVIICSAIKKYKYSSGEIVIELINSVIMSINP